MGCWERVLISWWPQDEGIQRELERLMAQYGEGGDEQEDPSPTPRANGGGGGGGVPP